MPKKRTKEQVKAKAAKRMRAIMKLAKQVRRENPNLSWQTCVKRAGVLYKEGKVIKRAKKAS